MVERQEDDEPISENDASKTEQSNESPEFTAEECAWFEGIWTKEVTYGLTEDDLGRLTDHLDDCPKHQVVPGSDRYDEARQKVNRMTLQMIRDEETKIAIWRAVGAGHKKPPSD